MKFNFTIRKKLRLISSMLIMVFNTATILLAFQNCSPIQFSQPTGVELSSQASQPSPSTLPEFQPREQQVNSPPPTTFSTSTSTIPSRPPIIAHQTSTSTTVPKSPVVTLPTPQGFGQCGNPSPVGLTSNSPGLCISSYGSKNFRSYSNRYEWVCSGLGVQGKEVSCVVMVPQNKPSDCTTSQKPTTSDVVTCPSGSASFARNRTVTCPGSGYQWQVGEWSSVNWGACTCLNVGEVVNTTNGQCSCPAGQNVKNGTCQKPDYEFSNMMIFYGPSMNTSANPSRDGFNGFIVEGQSAQISGIRIIECRGGAYSGSGDCRTRDGEADLHAAVEEWKLENRANVCPIPAKRTAMTQANPT